MATRKDTFLTLTLPSQADRVKKNHTLDQNLKAASSNTGVRNPLHLPFLMFCSRKSSYMVKSCAGFLPDESFLWGDLNENGPNRLIDLNAGPEVGSPVWEGLEV